MAQVSAVLQRVPSLAGHDGVITGVIHVQQHHVKRRRGRVMV
jgi:hypothetical protein